MTGAEFSQATKRVVADRAGRLCEAGVPYVCAGRGADFHHRRPRGAGGTSSSSLGAASNCLLLCRPCHDWIESNRAVALERGWLVGSGDDPAVVPVFRRGAVAAYWLRFLPDGHVDYLGAVTS